MKQQFIVLVECLPGTAYEVAQAVLSQKPALVSATYSISGEWDLLLRIELDAGRNVGEAVARILRSVPGIVKTYTIVGYPIWDPEDIFFEDGIVEIPSTLPENSPGARAAADRQTDALTYLQRFFVFVRCEPGFAGSVGLEIARTKKRLVRETSSISGEWDLLLLLEIQSGVDLGREVATLFSDIKRIVRTSTVVAFRIFGEE